jgi:Hydantoinase B/oxoprolinase
MRSESQATTSTPDGILRWPEVDPEFLKGAAWDGRFGYSYVPPPAAELRLPPEVQLRSEFDSDVDPITYQVLRNRFWSINLEHSDTIRRVSGWPVIVYLDDFDTALLTETADLLMAGPSIQWFAALGDLPIKWTMENRGENPGIGAALRTERSPRTRRGMVHRIRVRTVRPPQLAERQPAVERAGPLPTRS